MRNNNMRGMLYAKIIMRRKYHINVSRNPAAYRHINTESTNQNLIYPTHQNKIAAIQYIITVYNIHIVVTISLYQSPTQVSHN